jgi:hypothetical protein
MQNSMVLRSLVQVLHPPQKYEHTPSCNYGIKNHGIEVTLNNVTSLLILIKIYQHRQDGDLISLHFSCRKENRLKMKLANRGNCTYLVISYTGPSTPFSEVDAFG